MLVVGLVDVFLETKPVAVLQSEGGSDGSVEGNGGDVGMGC